MPNRLPENPKWDDYKITVVQKRYSRKAYIIDGKLWEHSISRSLPWTDLLRWVQCSLWRCQNNHWWWTTWTNDRVKICHHNNVRNWCWNISRQNHSESRQCWARKTLYWQYEMYYGDRYLFDTGKTQIAASLLKVCCMPVRGIRLNH